MLASVLTMARPSAICRRLIAEVVAALVAAPSPSSNSGPNSPALASPLCAVSESGARHPCPASTPPLAIAIGVEIFRGVRAYNPSTDLIIEDFMPYREAMARVV